MPTVCLYLKAHQPRRIKRYRVFDIGIDHEYFNDDGETDVNNEKILKKVVEKSYIPTNQLLLKLLNKYPSFRVSFSLTGTLLDQLEEYTPEVIALFQQLLACSATKLPR